MRVMGMVVAALLAVLSPAAAGGGQRVPQGGPTGDKATIAYYTAVTHNFNSKPADTEELRGAYFLGYYGSGWYVSLDTARPRYSWQHPVSLDELLVVSHDKIVWGTVTLSPTCRARPACGSTTTPLRFFFEHGASYWSALSGPHGAPRCWYRAAGGTAWVNTDFNMTGQQPWYVGNDPYTTEPHYGPMVHDGRFVKVTSTYSYRNGAAVTEIDTINAATKLFTAEILRVGAFKASPAYTSTGSLSVLSRAPARPSLAACG